MPRILLIEDEENLRLSLRETLERGRHDVREADCLKQASELVGRFDFDLVLTDVCLGSENGIDFVEQLRGDGFDGVIVVMTAFGTVENAVEAMRRGADDYIQKPVRLKELSLQAERWLERRRLSRRLELYERLEQARRDEEGVLGESEAWKKTLALAERLAGVPLGDENSKAGLPTILLLGETGSGKGVLARHIHETAVARERAAREQRGEGARERGAAPPFVQINCAALPATLVEAELFGHEKGAFTDAREARAGLFEMADGGTIFLDEIGEMPPELQAKLLLVVEQGVFRRVGGSRERRVRARVVAATNQDLEERVKKGAFRQDLFYRLNTFTIVIPPLRARQDDALLLAEAMLGTIGRGYGRGDLRFSPAAKNAIRRHKWPGNVRELVNSVQRAAMLAESSTVEAEDLGLFHAPIGGPGPAGAGESAGDLLFDFVKNRYTVDSVERALLQQALEHTRGNITQAAKLLEMQRSSLRYRIERHGLQDLISELTNQ